MVIMKIVIIVTTIKIIIINSRINIITNADMPILLGPQPPQQPTIISSLNNFTLKYQESIPNTLNFVSLSRLII